MATYSSNRLIIGKEEIGIFFCLNGIAYIWIFIYRNVYLFSSPLRFMRLFSKSLNLIGFRAAQRVKFCINVKKIFSETVWWIRLILCIHVYDMSLYINCFFYSSHITLVAMATYCSYRLIMGKVEIDHFCCLIGDI